MSGNKSTAGLGSGWAVYLLLVPWHLGHLAICVYSGSSAMVLGMVRVAVDFLVNGLA